jgi:hypothetical protein
MNDRKFDGHGNVPEGLYVMRLGLLQKVHDPARVLGHDPSRRVPELLECIGAAMEDDRPVSELECR